MWIANLALIKQSTIGSNTVLWCVVCSHKRSTNVSFVLMRSCAPNSNVFTGLQYMHTNLYQRMTDVCLGQQGCSWISLATLNHTRNAFDSIALVWYAEHPYINCSFQVMRVRTNKWLTGKKHWWVFGAITHQLYLASSCYTENRHLR